MVIYGMTSASLKAAQSRYRKTDKGKAAIRRSYRAAWQMRRFQLNVLKLAMGCYDCGYREHSCALDFDHVRGEKKFNLSAGTRVTLTALIAELEKCEVVCANCHRVRTDSRLVCDTMDRASQTKVVTDLHPEHVQGGQG